MQKKSTRNQIANIEKMIFVYIRQLLFDGFRTLLFLHMPQETVLCWWLVQHLISIFYITVNV